MKVKAKVLRVKTDGDQLKAVLQFNGKLPPEGIYVTVRWGSKRTLSQNSLYWVYLTWLIEDAGLKDSGHFCPQAFHENLKQYFKTNSTADLNKLEFGEYFTKVDQFIVSFFGIDTSPFWKEHEEFYKP